MKEINVPKIELSNEQLVWINELYLEFKKGNYNPNVNELRVKLRDKLSKGFNAYEIAHNVSSSNTLHLIGISIINPSDKIFEEVDEVYLLIKELIINKPSKMDISADELVNRLSLDSKRAELILYHINTLQEGQHFSVTFSQGSFGISRISWSENSLPYFLYYDGLEKLLEDNVENKEQKLNVRPRKYNSSLASVRDVAKVEQQSSFVPNTAFIIMAISEESEDTLNAIKETCSTYGVAAVRVDEIEHQDRISLKIIEKIKRSEFLIADLTKERPNVYYEIGYAHAIGKRPIFIRKEGTKIHFDIRDFKVITYGNHTELKKELSSIMEDKTGKVVD